MGLLPTRSMRSLGMVRRAQDTAAAETKTPPDSFESEGVHGTRNALDRRRSAITARLALAYSEQGKWSLAAAEYERVAAVDDGKPDSRERARAAQWQAAELYQKAADAGASRAPAEKAYETYVKRFPEPLERTG